METPTAKQQQQQQQLQQPQNERSNEQQARPNLAAVPEQLGPAAAAAAANYISPSSQTQTPNSANYNSNQQPASSTNNSTQQQAPTRGKISHRSQSSPSALTTHKFGLRPTPSPPRLVIDHNTGDIVESYLDQQPVYLRTYQPIVDSGAHPGGGGGGGNHHQPPITYYEDDELLGPDLSSSHTNSEQQVMDSSPQQQQQHQRDIYIQPTHSSYLLNNKRVPPNTSNYLPHAQLGQQQPSAANNSSSTSSAGHHQQKPPVALASDGQMWKRQQQPQQPTIRVTGASGKSKSNSGSGNGNNNNNGGNNKEPARYRLPAIEDFKLYKCGYNLNLLLVLLLSSYIIYLLLAPLGHDCARFRPTYAHLSLISCHVNLVAVVVFSLAWYCNGVTRAMYANLSSSAFIISIYTILVAINLSLAVVFFFINTCHYQKITSTPLQLAGHSEPAGGLLQHQFALDAHHLAGPGPASSPYYGEPQHPNYANRGRDHDGDDRDHDAWPILSIDQDGLDLSLLKEFSRQQQQQQQLQLQLQQPPAAGHQQHELAPDMSPIEAAWEYAREQLASFRRDFHRFLLAYDLKFVGALHVVVAICFQYLAIRVAVVRSHYCSPVGVVFCPV